MEPLVTVLMPVYNAEKYLHEAIESILHQTFSDFEFLIIDDGSTDNSLNIIKSYNDKRIRIEANGENIKLIASLNKGIDLAKGKYLCRMDADDISVNTRIEKQTTFLENNPQYIACGSWFESFSEKNDRTFIVKYEENHDDIRIRTLYQNHFCHGSTLINKNFILINNIRFENAYIHSEDYYFFVRLSEIGKLYNIQEPLLRVRQHNTNVSVLSSKTQFENSINVINYQLNKIGIDTKDINYDVYLRFFYSSFDLTKKEIELIENLLVCIIESNEKSNYLPQKVLVDFLCDKWYHLCFNSSKYGLWTYDKFRNSRLSKYLHINKFEKLKLLIKSGVKRFYF